MDVRPAHAWIEVIEPGLFRQVYPASFSDEDLTSMQADVLRICQAHTEPYAWAVDITNILKVSAAQRRIVSESERLQRPYDQKYLAGAGICARGAIPRGVLTAVFWMSPPVYPYKIFDNMPAAEKWAREMLYLRRNHDGRR